MKVTIQRPKDLPSASTPIDDAAVVPIDQLEHGVRKVTFGLLRAAVSGGALIRSSTTTIGPPTTGEFGLNELWIDALQALWICTAAGTPGSWRQITAAPLTSFPAGTPDGYEIVREDMGRVRFRYDGAGGVRINRKVITIAAPTDPWGPHAHGFGYTPAKATCVSGGKEIHGGVSLDSTNVTVNWGGNARSGELIIE